MKISIETKLVKEWTKISQCKYCWVAIVHRRKVRKCRFCRKYWLQEITKDLLNKDKNENNNN